MSDATSRNLAPTPPIPGDMPGAGHRLLDAPVLFLDFDGVTHAEGSIAASLLERLPAIESVITRYPVVRVVISSSWRLTRSMEELLKCFGAAAACQIVGKTPAIDDGHPYLRERECVQWLRMNAHPWVRWVALDDRPWLFRPFCADLIVVPWGGQGVEAAQLAELDARLAAMT